MNFVRNSLYINNSLSAACDDEESCLEKALNTKWQNLKDWTFRVILLTVLEPLTVVLASLQITAVMCHFIFIYLRKFLFRISQVHLHFGSWHGAWNVPLSWLSLRLEVIYLTVMRVQKQIPIIAQSWAIIYDRTPSNQVTNL